MLPLSGITHMASQEEVAAGLAEAQMAFFAEHLPKADLYVITPTSQSEGFSREVTEEVSAVEGVDVVSSTGLRSRSITPG